MGDVPVKYNFFILNDIEILFLTFSSLRRPVHQHPSFQEFPRGDDKVYLKIKELLHRHVISYDIH